MSTFSACDMIAVYQVVGAGGMPGLAGHTAARLAGPSAAGAGVNQPAVAAYAAAAAAAAAAQGYVSPHFRLSLLSLLFSSLNGCETTEFNKLDGVIFAAMASESPRKISCVTFPVNV